MATTGKPVSPESPVSDEPEVPAAISDVPENLDDGHVDDLIEKIAESDQLIANPIPSHHQIAADHISPSLYEDSDEDENLDEVQYHEPGEDKMSWYLY